MSHTPVFNKFICFSPVNSFCIILILRSRIVLSEARDGRLSLLPGLFLESQEVKSKMS